MKSSFRDHINLIKLMWKASKRDLLLALPFFPIYSLGEVLLAIGSAMLLQLLFITSQTVELSSLIPGKFKSFLDFSVVFNRTDLIFLIPGFIVSIGLIKCISRFMSTYLTDRAGLLTASYLRERMLHHFLSSIGNKIDKVNPDHVANQLMQDSVLLQGAITKGAMNAIRDFIVLFCIVVSLLLISWQFFLIGLAVVLPMTLLLRQISKRLNYYTKEGQKKKINISTRILQTHHSSLVVSALRAHGREWSDFDQLNDDNYKFMKKSLFVRTFFSPTMEFFGISLLAVTFYWRMHTSVDFNAINYSTMIILLVFSFRYIKNIAEAITFLSDMHVVFKRVTDYFNEYVPCTHNKFVSILPSYSKDAILAKNVSFAVQNDVKLLNNCNIRVPKGQKVAFVGESGSGKTTFLRTLSSLLIPDSGQISISNNHLMAFQTPYIYRGSTQENIIYNQGSKFINKDELRCHKLIHDLSLAFTESGIQIFLNKKLHLFGQGLSGGEKARVALARILFASPSLLLLDEPTANLDAVSSKFFWQAIEKWKSTDSENTVVVVSHLVREIIDFDYCYVFERGRIVKEGIPKEILYHD